MLENLVDGLLAEDEQLTINLKTRSGLSRRQQVAGTIPSPRGVEISYPGNSTQDARRFSKQSTEKACLDSNPSQQLLYESWS